jgi:hypothetical protein
MKYVKRCFVLFVKKTASQWIQQHKCQSHKSIRFIVIKLEILNEFKGVSAV